MATGTTKPPRPHELAPIDWAAIQPHYEAGVLSVRRIAKMFGITHSAISKRAASSGWTRNARGEIDELAEVALAKTTAQVERKRRLELARQARRNKPETSEAEIAARAFGTIEPLTAADTEVAAQALAMVQHVHRTLAGDARTLAAQLLRELHAAIEHPEVIAQAADALDHIAYWEPTAAERADVMAAINLVSSLPQRTNVLAKLVETLHKAVGLEREAWGLATAGGSDGAPTVVIKDFTGRGSGLVQQPQQPAQPEEPAPLEVRLPWVQ